MKNKMKNGWTKSAWLMYRVTASMYFAAVMQKGRKIDEARDLMNSRED
jgi:hypothetical protein